MGLGLESTPPSRWPSRAREIDRKREREREREKERERKRKKERENERKRDKQTDRERERKRERQRARQIESERERGGGTPPTVAFQPVARGGAPPLLRPAFWFRVWGLGFEVLELGFKVWG